MGKNGKTVNIPGIPEDVYWGMVGLKAHYMVDTWVELFREILKEKGIHKVEKND